MKTIYHFSGAGNDFVVIDGREGDVSGYREVPRIEALCRAFKTDGLMILGSGDARVDFTMEFYNPDGSGGMMCGNGGRCIVAFADYLGIRPASGGVFLFMAPDGLHTGKILERPAEGLWTVRIKMIDVEGITPMLGGYFLNTGTRHFVKFVEDVEQVDVETEGKALRWDPAFAPIGTNVNFVHVAPDGLHVRTFEKGVEGETLACGTGLTAAAVAAAFAGALPPNDPRSSQPISPWDKPSDPVSAGPSDDGLEPSKQRHFRLRARQDWLSVDFTPGAGEKFTDVYLTGPARLVEIR
ncbi:MAG: diaminopimelate epimerase [Bacteroidales bacterium]|nr:diaminopimelate epimerase [Bacteroidales bacterium]